MKPIKVDPFDPQDVGMDLLWPATCGILHPQLENPCILEEDHVPEIHQDGDGNEWMGRPSYD